MAINKTINTPEEVGADLVKNLEQHDPHLLILRTESPEGAHMRFALHEPADIVGVLVHQALACNDTVEALKMCRHLQKIGRLAEAMINEGLARKAANN